ncbi:hypothetical protein [[Muricauda] lutisoli]|uniref:Uncharacterized protein n=1 Tax=[Muricauda] lutisoli TaxID=2816035 RepID=A0ABS3ETI0_9FLAO|nr:hypothetical protein [[Muricauda] lutisoli]MBO0329438.1 hypothetical protein [[Muricauda] lutisoli]
MGKNQTKKAIVSKSNFQKSKKKVLTKTEDVVQAQKESQKKDSQLIAEQKKNNDLANELIEAQKKLDHLQSETIKRVMGSGYLRVLVHQIQTDKIRLIAESMSNYPIYDAEIRIIDLEKIKNCPKEMVDGVEKLLFKCWEERTKVYGNKQINSRKIRPINFTKKVGADNINLQIITTSRHSTIIQYSIINPKTKKHNYRIFEKIENNYTLLEKDLHDTNEKIFEQTFPYKKEIEFYSNEDL